MRCLFKIQKLSNTRVDYKGLPFKPTNDPSTVYVGKGFKGKPELLEKYVKGGIRFSEERRREIKNKLFARSMVNGILSLFSSPFPKIIYMLEQKE